MLHICLFMSGIGLTPHCAAVISCLQSQLTFESFFPNFLESRHRFALSFFRGEIRGRSCSKQGLIIALLGTMRQRAVVRDELKCFVLEQFGSPKGVSRIAGRSPLKDSPDESVLTEAVPMKTGGRFPLPAGRKVSAGSARGGRPRTIDESIRRAYLAVIHILCMSKKITLR